MVNEKLIGIIKEQQKNGIEKDQIQNNLLENGYTPIEIEEGFNIVNLYIKDNHSLNPNSKISKKMMWLTIILFFGVVSVCVGIYFVVQILLTSGSNSLLSYRGEDPKVASFSSLPMIKPDTLSATAKDVANIKSNTKPEIINCGTVTNFQKAECFINKAKDCTPSKITNNFKSNFLGIISEGSIGYEIKGWQNDKCLFYIKPIKTKVTFGEEAIQKFLENGITIEEIKKQEIISSKTAQSIIGRDGTCRFNKATNLVNLLKKWGEGSFSPEDFNNIDCTGEYFNKGALPINTSKTITYTECINLKGSIVGVSDKGTACFKNQNDIGSVLSPSSSISIKINNKNPQCCVDK